MELQADCLGGFYFGSRISLGQINQNDLIQTFNSACSFGDPAGYPWYAQGAHGSCGQRVSSVQNGIAGYLNGLLPGQACPST